MFGQAAPAFSFGAAPAAAPAAPAFSFGAPASSAATPAFGQPQASGGFAGFGAAAATPFGAAQPQQPQPQPQQAGGANPFGANPFSFSAQPAAAQAPVASPAWGAPQATQAAANPFGAQFGAFQQSPAFSQPQPQQQPPGLVTTTGAPIKHDTKWEELSADTQAKLLRVECALSTLRAYPPPSSPHASLVCFPGTCCWPTAPRARS